MFVRCPNCANPDTKVVDSREAEEGAAIRRRRVCDACGERFTTFERVQSRELYVIKSQDRREPFDRSKLERSIAVACRKRPVPAEKIERLAEAGIVVAEEIAQIPDLVKERIGVTA